MTSLDLYRFNMQSGFCHSGGSGKASLSRYMKVLATGVQQVSCKLLVNALQLSANFTSYIVLPHDVTQLPTLRQMSFCQPSPVPPLLKLADITQTPISKLEVSAEPAALADSAVSAKTAAVVS